MDIPSSDEPIGLSARICNVNTLLGGRHTLRTPSYQRPYTWSATEVEQLVSDLLEAYERATAFYFLGQIVLVRAGAGAMEIADGQQRLVTLTILLAYARDRLGMPAADSLQQLIMLEEHAADVAPAEPKRTPRLRLRRADADFFLHRVQVPNNLTMISAPTGKTTDAQGQMACALQCIRDILDERMTEAELAAFMRYVCRSASFVVIVADERGAAATVFATMNTRGQSLAGSDILKQELLERSGLQDEEAESAARTWEFIEDELGRETFSLLIEEILPLLITGEQLRSPGDLSVLRDTMLRGASAKEFIQNRLRRYGDALIALQGRRVNAGDHSADVNRRIALLLRLPERAWMAPAIKFLADVKARPEDTARFFRALDRLSHASFLRIVRADRRDTRFLSVLRRMDAPAKLYAPGGVDLSEKEGQDLLERLDKPFKPRSCQAGVMCWRLNAALSEKQVLAADAALEVEHVLPLNPGRAWEKDFPDRDQIAALNELLGNFALLPADLNRAAANKSFRDKREIYLADGAPLAQLTRDVLKEAAWTPAVLLARQERMRGVLAADWGLA